jgi:hypothetical protein
LKISHPFQATDQLTIARFYYQSFSKVQSHMELSQNPLLLSCKFKNTNTNTVLL